MGRKVSRVIEIWGHGQPPGLPSRLCSASIQFFERLHEGPHTLGLENHVSSGRHVHFKGVNRRQSLGLETLVPTTIAHRPKERLLTIPLRLEYRNTRDPPPPQLNPGPPCAPLGPPRRDPVSRLQARLQRTKTGCCWKKLVLLTSALREAFRGCGLSWAVISLLRT